MIVIWAKQQMTALSVKIIIWLVPHAISILWNIKYSAGRCCGCFFFILRNCVCVSLYSPPSLPSFAFYPVLFLFDFFLCIWFFLNFLKFCNFSFLFYSELTVMHPAHQEDQGLKSTGQPTDIWEHVSLTLFVISHPSCTNIKKSPFQLPLGI